MPGVTAHRLTYEQKSPGQKAMRWKRKLEFPQIALKKWICLPKVPICRNFERFRMAVPKIEAL